MEADQSLACPCQLRLESGRRSELRPQGETLYPERRYKFTESTCMHGASCSQTKNGGNCTWGKRVKEEVLVTGARALAATSLILTP